MGFVINGTTITKVVVNGTEIKSLNVKKAIDTNYTNVFMATTETIKTKTTTLNFSGTTTVMSTLDPDYGTIYTTPEQTKTVTDTEGTVTEITKVAPVSGSVYSAYYSGTDVKVELYGKSARQEVSGSVSVTYKVKAAS